MLTLKAGHKTFTISKDNLQKAEYFNSLLTRWNHEEVITIDEDTTKKISKIDEEATKKIIMIDEDPHLFRHFLNCLRHPTYEIPEKYAANVYKLLDFYGVKYNKINNMDENNCEIWKSKCSSLVPLLYKSTTYIFNGKLIEINLGSLIIQGYQQRKRYIPSFNVTLIIKFNGLTIFNRVLTSSCIKVKNYQCYFDTDLIYNLHNLEGEFTIEINNNDSDFNTCLMSFCERV